MKKSPKKTAKKTRAPQKSGRERTREHAAHSEAARFTAAYLAGMVDSTLDVTIGPARGAGDGEFTFENDPSWREIRKLILCLYAGHAAESRFDGGKGKARAITAGDNAKALKRLRTLVHSAEPLAKLEKTLRDEAKALVEEHLDAITALANALLERETLSNGEAARVVAIAEGARARRDLPRYQPSRMQLAGK